MSVYGSITARVCGPGEDTGLDFRAHVLAGDLGQLTQLLNLALE